MTGFDALGPDAFRSLQPLQPKPGRTVGEPLSGSGGDELPRLDDLRSGGSESSSEFGDALIDALDSVKGYSDDVKHKAEALARGEPVELHEFFIASSKSEVAFNMMLEVRNKLLEAWQSISRSAI